MGLFDFLKSTLDELEYKKKLRTRSISGCDERLKKFVARYPGEVIEGSIPISCNHIGHNDYSENTGYVEYYIRLEFFDGHTEFNWFNNLSDANLFRSRLPDGKYAKVIGPHSIYGAFR